MQLNIKKILIIVFIIITLGAAYKYYKKYRGTEKLKVAKVSLQVEKPLSDVENIIDAFQTGLNLKGYIAIDNQSDHEYTLSQLKVDAFSPATNTLIGEQTNTLENDIIIKAKAITQIPLAFNVDIMNALSLFKESGVIPEDSTLWQVITHPLQYFDVVDLKKLKIKLKGTIEAEGITLDINQYQFLYEDEQQ